jgi:tetratricopeptide (TPR) repeat protein
MRKVTTIFFVFITTVVSAQSDCRDVAYLMQSLWKHETGSAGWKRVSDSVLIICPNAARLWGDRGQAYMFRGEFVEGMAALNKAAKLDPYYFLGTRAWSRMNYMHDYKGAILDLDTLEKNVGGSYYYVTSMHMYILKGLSYEQLGDYEKALEHYTTAIDQQVKEKGENWVGSYDYLQRGILRYKMNDYDGAIEDLTRQVKEYESLADTYYYRGLAYAAVGRKDEARTDLQRSKDLILGAGQRRWEGVFVIPNEVYLSNVENALLKIY